MSSNSVNRFVDCIIITVVVGIIKYLNVSIIVLFIRNRYDIVNEIIGIIFLIVFVCFVVLSNILFINNNIIEAAIISASGQSIMLAFSIESMKLNRLIFFSTVYSG